MSNYRYSKGAFVSVIILLLLISLSVWSCKEKTPIEGPESPKGIFVQKLAYIQWGDQVSSLTPMISVADLYNDQGTFRLYNIKKLVEGTMPCLSKDEKWIAYVFVENGLFLKRVNVDGSNDKEIPLGRDSLPVFDANISPDGEKIALTVGSLGYPSIGIIPAKGGLYREVYNENGSAKLPEWSSDSKKIYFTWVDWDNKFKHNIDPFAKGYIASINTDGTDFRIISNVTNGLSDDYSAKMSPDGKTIVFDSHRSRPGDLFSEVFTMDVDGENVKRVTDSNVPPKHADHFDYYNMDGHAQWTRDGEHIIFGRTYYKYDHSKKQYTDVSDLFIINKDGTGLQNLTNNNVSSLIKRK